MTGAGTSAERRQAVRATAQVLYTGQLTADPAAQAYLASRGIDADLACRLGLGAAGCSWTGAVEQLRHAGYTDAELVDAGVGFRSGKGSVVDVFRSRVLFPAHDRHGQLVGWAGRSTPTAPPQAPAWLNSAAGDYRKAELLHGLHEGRTRLVGGAIPVLCEGVLDAHAIALATHSACIGLAPGGTTLTAQHVAALHQALPPKTVATERGSIRPRVLVAFDADDAGRHAAVAAWPLLHAAGLDTALVELSTGTDPAEVSAQVLRHAIHVAQPLADLVIDQTLRVAGTYPLGGAHGGSQPGRRPHHRHPATRPDRPPSHSRRDRPAHPGRGRHHSSHRRRHPTQHPQHSSGQGQRRLAPGTGSTPARTSLLTHHMAAVQHRLVNHRRR